MKITFQTTSGEKYVLEAVEDMAISDAKEKIEEMMNEDNKIKAEDQRYIFAGKILGDSDKFKSIENLKDGSCIFLMGKGKNRNVEKKEKASHPSDQPKPEPQAHAGYNVGGPAGYPQNNMGMGNDLFGTGMQQSFEYLSKNPSMIDMLYGQFMTNMTEEQKDNLRQTILTQIKEFQKDPRAFQQAVDYARNVNPASFNQVMGGGMPMAPPGQGGFPQMQPQQPYASPTAVPCSHGFYPPNFNPVQYGNFSAPPTHSSPSSPNLEQVYAAELKSLNEMGYSNNKLNLEALKKANGNISMAIQLLIDWPNN